MLGYLASKAGIIVSCQMDKSSLRQLSMVRVTCSPVVGASVAAGASVAGASVAAGGSVAAGSSRTGGASVAAPPPQAVRTSDRATNRLIRINNLRIFLLLSNWSCNVHFQSKVMARGTPPPFLIRPLVKSLWKRFSCSISFQSAHTRPDRQRQSRATRRVREQYPAGCDSPGWSAAVALLAQQ